MKMKNKNNENKVNTRGARFFQKKGCFFLHFSGARLRRAPFFPFFPLWRACGAPFFFAFFSRARLRRAFFLYMFPSKNMSGNALSVATGDQRLVGSGGGADFPVSLRLPNTNKNKNMK